MSAKAASKNDHGAGAIADKHSAGQALGRPRATRKTGLLLRPCPPNNASDRRGESRPNGQMTTTFSAQQLRDVRYGNTRARKINKR